MTGWGDQGTKGLRDKRKSNDLKSSELHKKRLNTDRKQKAQRD